MLIMETWHRLLAPTPAWWNGACSWPSRLLTGKSKKALGNKLRHRWLRLDAEGDTCEVTMSKAAIHHRYGVQVLHSRNLWSAAGCNPNIIAAPAPSRACRSVSETTNGPHGCS